ncbi:MAG TPA: CBM35 domain-containing protein [Polyangiaceae bacterium]|nr:CBM35 domain-containing protein [Polyangiaceae bacterium]
MSGFACSSNSGSPNTCGASSGAGGMGATAGSVPSSGGAGRSGTGGGGTSSGGSASSGAGGSLATGGSGGSSSSSTSDYEAEAAFFSGGASLATSASGFTGTGYVSQFTDLGAQLIFTVNAPAAGGYAISLRYESAFAASLSVEVNGYSTTPVSLPVATEWSSAQQTVSLRAGLNTITFRREASDTGDVAIDAMLVNGGLSIAARGATTPYVELEAEAATQTGMVVGPSRKYSDLAAEASGRKAVALTQTGQEIAFTLPAAANAITVRYSIPDSADGIGIDATLGLYAGDSPLKALPVSSKYAWVYGPYMSNGEAAQNDPSQGTPHHYFDEQRLLIGEQPAGTAIKLRKDTSSTAASYTVDLVEFEEVPAALRAPPGFISITDKGAIGDDGNDDTNALNAAISAAQAKNTGVFVPPGTFEINGHLNLSGVTIAGAGAWYSVLHGNAGKGGLFGAGGRVKVLDLALFGDVRNRNDGGSDTGIEGNFGDGSLIQNVWIEHTKVGMWFDGPTTGLYVVGARIRDTYADGVNLHKGTAYARIDQSSIRNTGDDALAMFSESQAVKQCAFTFDTVQAPLLANAIGIYGGTDNRASDNLLSDTVNASAGIAIGTRFAPVPFSGTQTLARNTLTRTGGYEPNWMTSFGGLWIYADTADITTPIVVDDLDIEDNSYQGILLSFQKQITSVAFSNVKIDGATSYGIDLEASGSASFDHVTVSNAAQGGLNNPGGYNVVRGSGNSGF